MEGSRKSTPASTNYRIHNIVNCNIVNYRTHNIVNCNIVNYRIHNIVNCNNVNSKIFTVCLVCENCDWTKIVLIKSYICK